MNNNLDGLTLVLRALALEMEKAGKAGKQDRAAGLQPRLEEALEQLRIALEQDHARPVKETILWITLSARKTSL